ncbi:MAG: ATP-binding protein [Draconibacterium sp.]
MSTHLYKLIQQGEHQQQDFKYCINDSKKIAKSLVAFANTDGGRLLIGVKDNGKIAGIKTDEEFYMVEAAAKIYSKPAISFRTQQWQVEGKTVLEIQVDSSNLKPHFAKDENGKWLAYIRIDDENFLAHKIQINVWKKQNSPTGIYFTYSDAEKLLIELLKKNVSLTFSKYLRLASISRQEAENILTNFVLMNLVEMNTSKERTTFSLNKNFDESVLEKFG